MEKRERNTDIARIQQSFNALNKKYIKSGVTLVDLQNTYFKQHTHNNYLNIYHLLASIFLLLLCVLYQLNAFSLLVNYGAGIRCIIPNNYFIWEATRPVSNCEYCLNVTTPIVLYNASQEEFAPFAYSSKPIIVKHAFLHWPAMVHINFTFFKDLYDRIDDAYRSVDEECQFLHFKSDFITLRDVFAMKSPRVNNEIGEKSWYVGWGNCHTQILQEMRKFYPKPHFLPRDCEIPSKEYVFMGYDAGATMHLDFINRLMWQAQLKGSKTWMLKPSPECDNVCGGLSFMVEPGDAVLVDTRVWYHGTTITPGEFSLSIQSEYG